MQANIAWPSHTLIDSCQSQRSTCMQRFKTKYIEIKYFVWNIRYFYSLNSFDLWPDSWSLRGHLAQQWLHLCSMYSLVQLNAKSNNRTFLIKIKESFLKRAHPVITYIARNKWRPMELEEFLSGCGWSATGWAVRECWAHGMASA